MVFQKIRGNSKIQERILELREQHKDSGFKPLGYRKIAEIISNEFDISISHQAIKDFIWNKYGKEKEKVNDQYEELKKRVLKRDNYTCKMCGLDLKDKMPIIHSGRYLMEKLIEKKYTAVVHHIEPSYEDTMNNLITLCNKCHITLHNELNYHNWRHYFKQKAKIVFVKVVE